MTTSTNNLEIVPEKLLSDATSQFDASGLHRMKLKADLLEVSRFNSEAQVTLYKRQETIHSRYQYKY